jgi:hypothetical protein
MDTYIALALAVPRRSIGRSAEVVARAASLTTLTKRVRALAPTATLALFDHASLMLCEGLPIRGMAHVPGRTIYLCAASADGAVARPQH